ncbi:MAG: outer membrane protein assembly factor BamE [Pseudomonadota bacterium]
MAILLAAALILPGCATVGRDFPVSQIPRIQIGQTTQNDIRAMFGEPWRVGIENGEKTWTYGKYRYAAFSESSTRDLVVRFNPSGVVTSYTYNTTE